MLTFSASNRTNFAGPPRTFAATWDYRTGEFVEYNLVGHQMLCGATSILPDGRVAINGGERDGYLFSIFDWRNNTWTSQERMNDPRWYNTSVALPDGRIFTAKGRDLTSSERWTSGTGWQRYTRMNWAVPSLPDGSPQLEGDLFPLLHLELTQMKRHRAGVIDWERKDTLPQ
jgi:hypothetical protein